MARPALEDLGVLAGGEAGHDGADGEHHQHDVPLGEPVALAYLRGRPGLLWRLPQFVPGPLDLIAYEEGELRVADLEVGLEEAVAHVPGQEGVQGVGLIAGFGWLRRENELVQAPDVHRCRWSLRRWAICIVVDALVERLEERKVGRRTVELESSRAGLADAHA